MENQLAFDLNTIYREDCFVMLSRIPSHSVNQVVSDPQYTTPTRSGFGREIVRSLTDFSIQKTYMEKLRDEFERILVPGGSVFTFCDDEYYPVLFEVFFNWKSTQLLIWDKGRPGLGRPFRRRHELIYYASNEFRKEVNTRPARTHYPTVLCHKPVSVHTRLHPAQKPVPLIEDLILGFTEPGDLVVDPFMGSGTTAKASQNTERKFVGSELDPTNHKICIDRINNGEKW